MSTMICALTSAGWLPAVLVIFFAAVLPFILLAVGFAYLSRINRAIADLVPRFETFEEHLGALDSCSMANADAVGTELAIFENPGMTETYEGMRSDSQKRYGGNWMPPLDALLEREDLFVPEFASLTSFVPAISAATAGILTAILLYVYISGTNAPFFPGLALFPLAVGLSVGAYLMNAGYQLRETVRLLREKLRLALTRALPVYNDHAGISLLISRLSEHETAIGRSLQNFNATADKLAASDFSDGICRSVRGIMHEEVAPPLANASNLLGDLARNLDRRQMTGMEKLAGIFSNSVAASLSRHLEPLRNELMAMNTLMEETHRYVETNVSILQRSRDENIRLNREISESLQLMTVAKNDLANEMVELTDNIKIVSATSERMAAAYAGEEASLSEKIKQLSVSMEQSLGTLSRGLQGSSSALQLAASLRQDQQAQHEEFSARLERLIGELNEISETLRVTGKNFTQESSAYVNQTLKSFDNGLAEVVERLIFTASAIRDAVDALPVALRQGKDQ